MKAICIKSTSNGKRKFKLFVIYELANKIDSDGDRKVISENGMLLDEIEYDQQPPAYLWGPSRQIGEPTLKDNFVII